MISYIKKNAILMNALRNWVIAIIQWRLFTRNKIITLVYLVSLLFTPMGYADSPNIGLDRLASQIDSEISKQEKKSMAVIDFSDLNGKVTEFGKFVAEEILTRLAKNERISIVERTQLKKIFEELKLQATGAVDDNTAKKLGKLLGADAICTGTVTELQKSVRVNARMIDTETGRVFAVAAVDLEKNDEIKALLSKEMIGEPPVAPGKKTKKYQKNVNLTKNGGFLNRYDNWKRSIGDITKGASQTEIIPFSHGKSGKALHVKHKGEGNIQFAQVVEIPGPDLVFSASFQATSHEGPVIGFSGTGIVQIGLQYFDESGKKLGETVILNYVKNPFADTPLIGVPRRKEDTYKTHYIEFFKGKYYQDYQISIREEIENNLLGMDPESVRQIAVVLWCSATDPQAGSELWITDIGLKSR